MIIFYNTFGNCNIHSSNFALTTVKTYLKRII